MAVNNEIEKHSSATTEFKPVRADDSRPLYKQVQSAIRDAMSEVDPENAATYQANAEAYIERLSALHSHALSEFGQLPADRRTVVPASPVLRDLPGPRSRDRRRRPTA